MEKQPVFICPLCKRRSYHPMDIREHYCGKCGFVDDVIERLLTRRE
jgi:ribosomal protein L37E